jgi:hypothetical protein
MMDPDYNEFDLIKAAIERFGPEAFGLEDMDREIAWVMVALGAGGQGWSEAVELARILLV